VTGEPTTAAGRALKSWSREEVTAQIVAIEAEARAAALADVTAAVGRIHYPEPYTDYVAIPPLMQTVCRNCAVADGFAEWPCDTWAAIKELENR